MGLFPERIKKSTFLVHHSDLEKVLDSISEEGIIQIINIDPDNVILKEMGIDEHISKMGIYENRLSKLISILRSYEKRSHGIKSFFTPSEIKRIRVKKKDVHHILEETDHLLDDIESKVLDANTRLKLIDEEIKKNRSWIETLHILRFLEVDIGYMRDSEYVTVKIGITKDPDVIRDEIKKIDGVLECRPIGKRKEKRYLIVALVHRSYRDFIDKIWQRYLENIDLPSLSGKPSDAIKTLDRRIEELQIEKRKVIEELKKLADTHLIRILAKLEEIKIEKAKMLARRHFGKTDSIYVIQGWILSRDSDRLRLILERSTGGRYAYSISEPSSNPEMPPTYIETNPITEPFKSLLTLFGLPKYGEINPLSFLVFWFPLMFGFMLGDAGYGLVILLGSLFSFLKFGGKNRFIRGWSVIGIFLGVWTVIFGYVSNSFFGDLLPRFFNMSLPKLNLMGVTLPIDGLKNPLVFLQIALILGIVHLNLGLILGIVKDMRNNDIKDLIYGKLSFILLQIFGGALIGEYLLKIWALSSTFNTICLIGSLFGFVLLSLEAKGMAFMELMGFVGDWLSYARLLALGLATAGMALAFNIVAQLFGNMIHVAVSLLVLFVAHPAILGLNSLGAAVHSLRLQYVEFFNRFFEGGGKPFSPLKLRRMYTELM